MDDCVTVDCTEVTCVEINTDCVVSQTNFIVMPETPGNCTTSQATFMVNSDQPCISNPTVVINDGIASCEAGVPVKLEMTGCCGTPRWFIQNIAGPGTVTITDDTANPTFVTLSVSGNYTVGPGTALCCEE